MLVERVAVSEVLRGTVTEDESEGMPLPDMDMLGVLAEEGRSVAMSVQLNEGEAEPVIL